MPILIPEELDLELDDLEHVYRLGGVTIPGCTTVLAAMGAIRGFGFLSLEQREFYQSRGKAGHKAIELMIKDEIDRRTIAKELKGYLKSWEIAVNQYKVEPMMLEGSPFVEVPLSHVSFRYGVRPDIVASINGVPSIVELKLTSGHTPATALQTASQLLAARLKIPELRNRYAFRLDRNGGPPDVRKYSDPSDEGVWLSMLNAYNWRKANKLL